MISRKEKEHFVEFLLEWYTTNGREFPWRYTFNPYYVLISEILLQQTNADKVVQSYMTIVNKYNSIFELAEADINFLRDIFKDLGLFYRADRMVQIAEQIMNQYKGKIPSQKNELIKIKGIGDYVCGAVLCFGYNKPYAIVDTNIIRIFERFFNFKSEKKRPRTDKRIWEFAQELLPEQNYVDYNYALLDFGALMCTAKKQKCDECEFKKKCSYNYKIHR